ncbi:hypothetical protein [uncultured Sphaerotilus sp.]|uniref:hypothetical protein n=1 Tax=uncultured Sphaerotilus sp. TaxID=474984 RepID=UPI0030CA4CF3
MTTGIAASKLAKMSEDELYSHLGAINKEDEIALNGPITLVDGVKNLSDENDETVGKLYFRRLNKQAKEFFCGGCSEDGAVNCLDRLKSALNLKNVDSADAIKVVSGLFLAQFGWPAVIAGIVAAVLVNFLLPAVVEDLCSVWIVD